MMYVTGDIHGEQERFVKSKIRRLKKGDVLLVCGDLGMVWTDTEEEIQTREWLSKQPYTVLFVEGAHDNVKRLEQFPKTLYGGGWVRKITDNLLWLQRGQVYNIDNKRVFAFGSGLSEHYAMLTDIDSVEAGTLPTAEEKEFGRRTLANNQNEVDIVLTYDAPTSAKKMLGKQDADELNNYLEELQKTVYCKHWYFGHYHKDKILTRIFRAVYTEVVAVE